MNKLHLIYIPGLGDSKIKSQMLAVNVWRAYGVEAEIIQMNWADKQPWEIKFRRILDRIDQLTKDGKRVALVGASAGASAVINAYSARKDNIVGCVLIAGKVNNPESVGTGYSQPNPAFVTSLNSCQQSLASLSHSDRSRILSRYALADETVHRSDSKIDGANNSMVPTIGHVLTIATQITLGAPSFIKFLKKKSEN